MEIKLPQELEIYLLDRVQAGEYASVDELVVTALEQHRNLQEELPEDIVRELEAADADMEAGNAIAFDDFVAATRKRLRSQ